MIVDPTVTRLAHRDVIKRCIDCRNVTRDQADRCWLCSHKRSVANAARMEADGPIFTRGTKGVPVYRRCSFNP